MADGNEKLSLPSLKEYYDVYRHGEIKDFSSGVHESNP